MAIITNVAYDWSNSVTLTGNEFWQVRVGPVYIATDATAAPSDLEDGFLVNEGDIMALSSGDVLRYRSARPDVSGRIVRRVRV